MPEAMERYRNAMQEKLAKQQYFNMGRVSDNTGKQNGSMVSAISTVAAPASTYNGPPHKKQQNQKRTR